MTSPRLNYGDVVKTHHEPPASCATPACSLTRLSIIGNMGGGFVHLPLLVQNSHSSLRELYLEHLGDKEAYPASLGISQSIADALAPCTNLRDPGLCTYDLALASLLSIASRSLRLRSITLPRWPHNDDLAAIPRGVRALTIYDMSAESPTYFPSLEVSEPWYDLHPAAHLPLSDLQVVCPRPTLDGD